MSQESTKVFHFHISSSPRCTFSGILALTFVLLVLSSFAFQKRLDFIHDLELKRESLDTHAFAWQEKDNQEESVTYFEHNQKCKESKDFRVTTSTDF